MIKNIIFDFGGVVLKHGQKIVEGILAEIFSIPFEKAEEFWKEEKTNLLIGKETSREFLLRIRKKIGSKLGVEELEKMWIKLYKVEAKDVDEELLEFVDSLKRKYKVYLFTDTIELHDRYNLKRKIYDKFDRVFKSFEEGFKKPNKKAYLNVLEKIGALPYQCVFIDDTPKNVKTAIGIGMRAIVYKNLKQLKRKLANLGVRRSKTRNG